MSINITGKHIEVGDSLRTRIEEMVSKISQRYFGDPIDAHIVVTKETHRFIVDFSVHVSNHFVVRSHGEDGDPYRACDLASDHMEQRIRRYKSRLRDRKRHTQKDDFFSAQQYVVNATEEDEGSDTPVIIAEINTQISTLSVGEAVMRMDLSNDPVLMFKNAKNGGINVVYRRSDGHIGWIDPSIVSPSL